MACLLVALHVHLGVPPLAPFAYLAAPLLQLAGISAIGRAVALASAGNRASAASSWQYTAVGHTAPDSLLTNYKVKQLVTDYRQPAIQIVKPLFAE